MGRGPAAPADTVGQSRGRDGAPPSSPLVALGKYCFCLWQPEKKDWGQVGGRHKKEGIYIVVMTDLHCCIAETNATLLIFQLKKNNKHLNKIDVLFRNKIIKISFYYYKI